MTAMWMIVVGPRPYPVFSFFRVAAGRVACCVVAVLYDPRTVYVYREMESKRGRTRKRPGRHIVICDGRGRLTGVKPRRVASGSEQPTPCLSRSHAMHATHDDGLRTAHSCQKGVVADDWDLGQHGRRVAGLGLDTYVARSHRRVSQECAHAPGKKYIGLQVLHLQVICLPRVGVALSPTCVAHVDWNGGPPIYSISSTIESPVNLKTGTGDMCSSWLPINQFSKQLLAVPCMYHYPPLSYDVRRAPLTPSPPTHKR